MTNAEKTALQKEICDSMEHYPWCRLLLAPRVGKTKLIIDKIKKDKYDSILWVTPFTELIPKVEEEFITWKAKRYVKKLTCVTWKSLATIEGDYDLIVFDEEQFITANGVHNLLNGSLNTKALISMTGTATTNRDKINLYSRLKLEIAYEISINDAVEIGLLCDYEINIIGVDLDTRKNKEIKMKKGGSFMTSDFESYKYVHKKTEKAIKSGVNKDFEIRNRMNTIFNNKTKLETSQRVIDTLFGRKLIFAPTQKLTEAYCESYYHSKSGNKHLQKFIKGETDCLSLIHKGGTGFTYKALDHLIITQADSDATGRTSQKISRTLLKQGTYKAHIWIICLMGTQDVVWVQAALKRFNKDKINFLTLEDYENKFKDSQNIKGT